MKQEKPIFTAKETCTSALVVGVLMFVYGILVATTMGVESIKIDTLDRICQSEYGNNSY